MGYINRKITVFYKTLLCQKGDNKKSTHFRLDCDSSRFHLDGLVGRSYSEDNLRWEVF